jgi:hypothetical protein
MRFNPFRGSLIATALLIVAPATALAQRYTTDDRSRAVKAVARNSMEANVDGLLTGEAPRLL